MYSHTNKSHCVYRQQFYLADYIQCEFIELLCHGHLCPAISQWPQPCKKLVRTSIEGWYKTLQITAVVKQREGSVAHDTILRTLQIAQTSQKHAVRLSLLQQCVAYTYPLLKAGSYCLLRGFQLSISAMLNSPLPANLQ